jgi:hypothetical protein
MSAERILRNLAPQIRFPRKAKFTVHVQRRSRDAHLAGCSFTTYQSHPELPVVLPISVIGFFSTSPNATAFFRSF